MSNRVECGLAPNLEIDSHPATNLIKVIRFFIIVPCLDCFWLSKVHLKLTPTFIVNVLYSI